MHNIDRNFLLQKQCNLPIENVYGTSAHTSHLKNALRWQPKNWKYHRKEHERSFPISHLTPMFIPSPREFKLTTHLQPSTYNTIEVCKPSPPPPPILSSSPPCPSHLYAFLVSSLPLQSHTLCSLKL